MKILIVDDDPANITLLRHLVDELEGAQAVTFTHPAEALQWSERNEPDMVLVDYMMPGIDGLEFIRRFRALENHSDIPVVMVTSAGGRDVRRRALELGASDFLNKPLDSAEFFARARNMLALAESRRALANRAAWLAEEVDRATSELRQSEERYALAARGANDGLWDWNLETDQIYFSARWKNQLGFDPEELPDTTATWFERVHPDDVEGVRHAMRDHLDGREDFFHREFRILHKDGTWRWVLTRGVAVTNGSGKAVRMAGSQTDVTARKKAEEQMLHDAFHDGLTGLPNRALFMDRLGQAIHRSRREHRTYAVMFLGLDRFKLINDSLGHGAGDELLQAWTRIVSSCLRPSDTLARLGGDIFTILLEDVGGPVDVTVAAKRIQEATRPPFQIQGTEVFCTASIGIALGSVGYERAEDLLRDADVAMHRAKAQGPGRYQVFEEEMHAGAVSRLELETDLRRALERGELSLYYQPVVRLDSGRIVGFEALLRWLHPRKGLILPGDFIGIAEEAGLIVPIGEFVVSQAYHQLKEWDERFPDRPIPYVAINLSSRQFRDRAHIDELVRQIREATAERRLHLEITESLLVDNAEQVAGTLKEIKSLGARISIDDFGTGYSSLSYLHRFPVDILKIDRAFVGQIETEDSNVGIVRAIIRLGHDLGMTVVAEGVETSQQRQKLQELDCEYGQGYFFSHPLTATDATGLIVESPSW